MANKKINELSSRTPSLTDLILVGDPSSGYSYKATVTVLTDIIQTDIADAYVTLDTTQTISGAKTFSNVITATSVANAASNPNKFLVLNGSNIINYRTGSQVLSDIGGQGALTLTTTGSSGSSTLVYNTLNIPTYTLSGLGGQPLSTNLTSLSGLSYASTSFVKMTASGTFTLDTNTYYLSSNPNGYTSNTGTVTSVTATAGTGISISGSPITSSGTLTITNTAPDQVVDRKSTRLNSSHSSVSRMPSSA